jgi:formate dehydrogenase iron-sulfur subunit
MTAHVTTSAPAPGYDGSARPRMGFFTDTTVCIGCKACEVACKEWNDIPAVIVDATTDSYDNHRDGLDANTWRHVTFIEQRLPRITEQAESGLLSGGDRPGDPVDLSRIGTGGFAAPPDPKPGAGFGGIDTGGHAAEQEFRWLMSSDVCKHCTTAACLDVCPTGSLFKTEFATVVVQEDICNGCGYCIPACPYGVIGQREGDGRAWKCTLCYDRLKIGEQPACAKACPTDSITFGPLDELRTVAEKRLEQVTAAGVPGARLYGDGPSEGVDGAGSLFLLLDDPEVYGLPPDPIATTKHLPQMWKAAGVAAGVLVGAVVASFAGGRS